MSKKKIFDVVMLVLSVLFMVAKAISEKCRIPGINDEIE